MINRGNLLIAGLTLSSTLIFSPSLLASESSVPCSKVEKEVMKERIKQARKDAKAEYYRQKAERKQEKEERKARGELKDDWKKHSPFATFGYSDEPAEHDADERYHYEWKESALERMFARICNDDPDWK